MCKRTKFGYWNTHTYWDPNKWAKKRVFAHFKDKKKSPPLKEVDQVLAGGGNKNPNFGLLKIDFLENQVSDRGRTTFPTKVWPFRPFLGHAPHQKVCAHIGTAVRNFCPKNPDFLVQMTIVLVQASSMWEFFLTHPQMVIFLDPLQKSSKSVFDWRKVSFWKLGTFLNVFQTNNVFVASLEAMLRRPKHGRYVLKWLVSA